MNCRADRFMGYTIFRGACRLLSSPASAIGRTVGDQWVIRRCYSCPIRRVCWRSLSSIVASFSGGALNPRYEVVGCGGLRPKRTQTTVRDLVEAFD